MRKKKLYLSELLERCTNKLLKIYVITNNQKVMFDTVLIAIRELKDTWLWDYQVVAYTIIDKSIIIGLEK